MHLEQMSVVFVSYEILNADELHLTRKYRRYFHAVPKCKFSPKKRQFRKSEWCHIYNTVTEQSSPKPNIESKFNFNLYDRRCNKYQYFSDSELCKMPLDFENSSMKNSFSMSSLQPSSRICLEQSSQATNGSPVLPNRAYNSLNHKLKKRSPEQDSWRNSWGQDDQKDEFWTSFESNYQYLMNNNLIDSCKEAKNDLNPSPSADWTYSHFKQQFLELDNWLNSIQKTIHANEDNLIVQNIRLSQIDEMKRKNYQRKNFVNQSSRMVTRFPEYKDEILDCVSQLNTKWDQLAQTVSPKRNISGDCFSIRNDVLQDLRGLGKWIEAMEHKLEPLNFRKKWSLSQLKLKAKENEIIQRDVESHHKTVQSVVKLCEKLSRSNAQSGSSNGVRRESPLLKAQRWERRWQQLYLRCIEWQCYIEQRLEYLRFEYPDDTGAESDDEQPASKNPRLNSYMPDTLLSVVKNCEDSDVDGIMDTGENMLSWKSAARDLEFGNDVERLNSNRCDSSPRNALPNIELNDNFHSTLIDCEGKMIPEGALFNRTVNSSKNVGVHYCRHEDTDPELEKRNGDKVSVDDDMKSTEESSEEEWTYKNAAGDDSMETEVSGNDEVALGEVQMSVDSSEELRNLSKMVLTDVKLEPHSIQKLVEQADELVQTPKKSATRRKYPSYSSVVVRSRHDQQVLEWLHKTHPVDDYNSANSVGDSCDASGEYTTEDDDQYDRRSSCDQTMTLIGSSEDNGIDVSPVNEEPKVILRVKNSSKKQRPFSTSGLASELAHASPSGGKLAPMQWVSESALQDTLTSSLTDAHGALSSSTVEECTTQTLESSGCSMNSLRRRKLKQRRRSNMGRKGHSGSADSLSSFTCRDSSSSVRHPRHSPVCVKSDAFSEPLTRPRFSSVERAIASDPANCVHHSTSGTETEEELSNSRKSIVRRKLLQLPAFRLGPHHGVVTCRDKIAFGATSAEEQLSSFSEHAWDDFQERYVSEAYSEEPVDPDQVKRVTEFGEDYRNYIDSHSDCASSFTKRSYPIFGHSTLTAGDESSALDSDSELEDIRNFLEKSRLQLRNAEELFAKQSAKPTSCFSLLETDFVNLRNACRENIRCLKVFLERIVLDMPSYKVNIESMLEKWDTVESRTDELERKCILYRKIMELRKQLLDISAKTLNFTFNIEDSSQLEQNVLLLKNELDHINDKKSVISDYNFQVHQLSKDSKYSSPPLTEDINDLYRIWEETHQKIFNQLTNLQNALWTWRQFDIHMLELKTVLREDHTALNVLDRALKQEQCNSEEVALTVKNIAKYLPDKHHDNIAKINCNSTVLDNEQIDGMSNFLMNTLHVEGSFSDSGISDSGSEQDMCERERKLALLKKLVRHLQALLAPGSDALRTIIKKIDEAEEEIKELQRTCRTIMKTGYLEKEDQILLSQNKSSNDNFQTERTCVQRTKTGDPESDPHRGRSIFWRVLRASLPFHMAFVVLLFVAYLLEPNCCDAINNLNLSLTPQLRYISGPPPT